MPRPTWLAGTSMFSASGDGSFRLQRQETMPSLREKIDVVGTGGAPRICSMTSPLPTLLPLSSS